MKTTIRFIFSFLAALVTLWAGAAKVDSLTWHSAEKFPVLGTVNANVEGQGRYNRLPDSMMTTVRKPVADLARNSAGISLRFRSDATEIGAKWKSLNKFNMNHMTATGIRGVDLYMLLPDSTWTTVGSGRPSLSSHNNASVIITNMEREMREYMLFLSLYDGVDSLFIGTDSLAVVELPKVNLPVRNKPVVMYGTSILQGGCATRPGMAHTNILQRMLNREVYNFGFSGNAKFDKDVAELIASIDASVFVIDALPNNTPSETKENFLAFFNIIRANNPKTPIVLVASPIFPLTRFNGDSRKSILEKNAILKEFYDSLTTGENKDCNLYYFRGEDVFGDEVEGTVDNYHLTDLGFKNFADALAPLIRQLIE